MSICVVITGLNDEGTILESTESVLSQARYPDQIGFSHGPSRDSTEEFAGFYREEFDFVHWDSRINPSECGLMHLRLGTLSDIETTHVVFLRANSYLYRDALARADEILEENDLILSPVQFMAPGGSDWTWAIPDQLNQSSFLELGPLPAEGVIWNVSLLKEVFGELQSMKLGPFTTLGWLRVLREMNPEIAFLETPLVEAWDFREADHCWTRSVHEQMHETFKPTHSDDRLADLFRSAVTSAERPPGVGPEDHDSEVPEDQQISSDLNVPWLKNRYPMVE
ncbi:MAG: hypothetical protein ABEK50_12250 [bacterium]